MELPYGVEGWTRMRNVECGMRNVIGAVGFIVEALCYIALGAGLAVLLQALHWAGVTP
jgi:hypothetical protein